MGQTSSADRSAADRELVEKSEKSSLLTDTDDGKVSQPSSPVGSPERVDPAAAPARPKPEAQEEASSSAAATVRTAAAVVSWMGLNITIGNLNGWILKRHAFGYPVRTPTCHTHLLVHARAGCSRHPLATIAPPPHHARHARHAPAPAVHSSPSASASQSPCTPSSPPSAQCPRPTGP